jgi:hypothetical protein
MRGAAIVLIVAACWSPPATSARGAGRQTTTPPPATRPAASQDYRFPTPAGILFFHVKPDRTADFEAVVARLHEVIDKSEDPVRKQQAASWRVLKSAETPQDAVIYLFFFDPAVAGADYDPVKILGEGLPSEVHALYERLRGATIKIERMGLQKIR